MKIFFKSTALLIIAYMAFGCSGNYYNIPRETFEKKVKILGVAPILIDTESDIRYPEKEALINLIKVQNRKNERELVAMLRDTGTFFSVRLLDDDADSLFTNLMFRKERRDDASVVYNKYFYKLPELKELVSRNGLDAIMLTVVSGISREDTVRSSNLISYLKCDYNSLIMTSQILDADGNILWEFPNFRENSPSLPPFFDLQYPAFDEAKANETDSVDVKFKTIPGITRAFNKTEDSTLGGDTKVSKIYASIFSDMAALLKPEKKFLWWGKKEDKQSEPQQQQVPPTLESTRPAPIRDEISSPKTIQPELIKEEPVAPPIKENTIKEESIM